MGARTMQIRNGCTTSKKQHMDSVATITSISRNSSNASLAQINLKCSFGKTIIRRNEFVDKKNQGVPLLSQMYAEERSGLLSPQWLCPSRGTWEERLRIAEEDTP